MRTWLNRTPLFVISLVWFFSFFAAAQPKREFRGAWVATVSNIDWPSSASYGNVPLQQSDLIVLFDSLKRVRVNAVVFQVRPSCDAFYKSDIEPWSQWLNGTQGLAPADTSFDPLQFAINEARRRGFEFHAWFNPYRAVVNSWTSIPSSQHISVTHPEYVISYPIYSGTSPNRKLTGYLKVLDPGLPVVREYVISVIMDVVRRYDIDAVHFDDYFYPYPTTDSLNQSVPFPDAESYANFNPLGMPLPDWRRDNVNRLVQMISDSIRAVKPRVKFGISPFGIWRNASTDPIGSATSGLQSYDAIYADTRKWLQEGWIDYAAPQVYWRFGFAPAAFDVLVPWWNVNGFSRHMYIGHAVHQIEPNGQDWPVQQLVDQISFLRDYLNIGGSIHFSAKYFRSNGNIINDSLRMLVYQARALVPCMAWKDTLAPMKPDSVVIRAYPTAIFLDWNQPAPAADGELPQQYIVYKSTSLPIDYGNMRNVFYMGSATGVGDVRPMAGTTQYYAVSALDRNQNESPPTGVIGIDANDDVTGIGKNIQPTASVSLSQNFPNPFNPTTLIQFRVPGEARVSFRVYDVLGREVAVLADGFMPSGDHQVYFDGTGLASGVYFCRIVAVVSDGSFWGSVFVETKKMQLLR